MKVLKFIWQHKRSQTATLSKESNAGGLTTPNLKLHHRAIVTRHHNAGTNIDTVQAHGTEYQTQNQSTQAQLLPHPCTAWVLEPWLGMIREGRKDRQTNVQKMFYISVHLFFPCPAALYTPNMNIF